MFKAKGDEFVVTTISFEKKVGGRESTVMWKPLTHFNYLEMFQICHDPLYFIINKLSFSNSQMIFLWNGYGFLCISFFFKAFTCLKPMTFPLKVLNIWLMKRITYRILYVLLSLHNYWVNALYYTFLHEHLTFLIDCHIRRGWDNLD